MEGFTWMNEPLNFKSLPNGVEITTKKDTDFWQRTHYGFRRDDGHFLYKKIKGDFILEASTDFAGSVIYDQCGIMACVDENNWIKSSTEFENSEFSHLGAVVTNNGYSDWSTQEIPSTVHSVKYIMERTKDAFFIKASINGGKFTQIRVAHFDANPEELMVGVYACSPQREGFTCKITDVKITPK
ncbi:hypothetical protein TVAG_193470 [Trichomonas vaginalis G3]|uniref:DUF1349 domain-containing protein n=1 Tax=Trichomonas vaginalis (strain ATCC PRA-98 / G3) TaxID=412133 RepID=A2DH61_TRIV3|nr:protein of unknown function, DUF1349 family [Trichomonas vaginalis G3]EAY20371.1 hypothetical protein TVAG_193470 [Trichomonas vaginalis G3]KAI5530629.1 protein of unknown function, DUF1349 family [Trichomonas vaginalis G3]|eukprot:XP_001581357.1 hypothetical protein [Trichomonas vaginalis G3]